MNRSIPLIFATALVAALATACAAGCGSSSSRSGGLFVTVKDPSMATVADAVVSTDPATQAPATDALGTVLFAKMAPGFYSVTAVHPALGSARAPVTVKADALTELTLVLRKDGPVSGEPDAGNYADARVDVGSGGSGGMTGSADAGTGGVQVGGRDGGADGPADGSTVDPAWSVVLAPLSKDSNGVDLAWTTSGTFASYRIYRAKDTAGTFELIDILNAPAASTYRDDKPQLGGVYRYRVGGLPAAGGEVLSNIQMITAGVFISVDSQVERMKSDPKRPYLYLVDRVNNSLHFVNLTTNSVETTIFVGSTPSDLDINQDGSELFVANFGSTEIAVVDLDTRLKTRSLLVDTSQGTWDGNPFRLVCTAGNTLVFTSEDQWNDLKLVNATNGAHITTAGSIYYPALVASPDGTRVYVGESGSTGSALIRFDIAGSALTQVDSSTTVGGYGSRQVNITANGMYVFYAGQKYLANNLKSVLGTFSEVILVANHDGTVAVGATKIHNGTTFAAIKTLPLSTSIMALSADETTLYLYDTVSSRIFLYKL